MESIASASALRREPWKKGKIVGQKAPFKVKDVWALRVRLQIENRVRELALFNLGIDSKLWGCDLVAMKFRDVCHSDQLATRAIVMQHRATSSNCPPTLRWLSCGVSSLAPRPGGRVSAR